MKVKNKNRAGGRSDILLKTRRIFGHDEEAPSHDEETPQS